MKRFCRINPPGILLFLIVILILTACPLFSQSEDYYWYTFAIGNGKIEQFGRIAGLVEMTHQVDRNHYSIRYLISSKPFNKTEFELAWDFGFLYSWSFTPVYSKINVIGGIGVALTSVSVPNQKFIGPSIPLEVQIMFRPFRPFCIGVSGYANINGSRNFYGICAGFRMGKDLNI
ncbi:MAG: hypothetical protein ACM3SY_02900 [Candidatus Omnitrophota bacterium]